MEGELLHYHVLKIRVELHEENDSPLLPATLYVDGPTR